MPPKLIRDRIPDIIERNGEVAVTRLLRDDELRRALLDKLAEETQELRESLTLEEAADVLEVLFALTKELGYNEQDLFGAQQEKQEARGGFSKGVYLLDVQPK